MSLAKRVREPGIPILIGYPGARNYACEFFGLDPRYKTEVCTRPEYVKLYLEDGRGIIRGCTSCPLFALGDDTES